MYGFMRLLMGVTVVLSLVGCIGYPSDAFHDSAVLRPIVEKRDTLVATGYAVIAVQDSEIAAQRRLLAIRAAKLDAYRSLTEQVYGQYLDSTATVSQMAVQSDSFRSRVEGVKFITTTTSL